MSKYRLGLNKFRLEKQKLKTMLVRSRNGSVLSGLYEALMKESFSLMKALSSWRRICIYLEQGFTCTFPLADM